MVAPAINEAQVRRLVPLLRSIGYELAIDPDVDASDVAAAIGAAWNWPPPMVRWLSERLDRMRGHARRCLNCYGQVAADRGVDLETFAGELRLLAGTEPETAEKLLDTLQRLRTILQQRATE